MTYEKQRILTEDRNPDGGSDYEVPEFLRAVEPALQWQEEEDTGSESHSLYAAYSASLGEDHGGRCWLHSWHWDPKSPYTARGYGSELITFEEGVELFLKHDVFSFPLPVAESSGSAAP